ncbi:hypothetical protein SLE2022_393470 [Rubroshorea leprosula]
MLPSAASLQLAKSYNPKDSGRLQSYHKGRSYDYYELMDTSWLARGMESTILFIKARDCTTTKTILKSFCAMSLPHKRS